jgi:hypothetical protein
LKRVLLIAAGVLLFLAISGLLARFFAAENVERSDELALIEAETRGDPAGVVKAIHHCSTDPACVASARANAKALRRAGSPKILSVKSTNSHSLTSSTGTARLAWTVIGKLPVVQCVKVHRAGNFLTGIDVTVLSLSAPISNEGVCGKRTQIEIEEEEDTEAEH